MTDWYVQVVNEEESPKNPCPSELVEVGTLYELTFNLGNVDIIDSALQAKFKVGFNSLRESLCEPLIISAKVTSVNGASTVLSCRFSNKN